MSPKENAELRRQVAQLLDVRVFKRLVADAKPADCEAQEGSAERSESQCSPDEVGAFTRCRAKRGTAPGSYQTNRKDGCLVLLLLVSGPHSTC